jgi:hypothetical protein
MPIRQTSVYKSLIIDNIKEMVKLAREGNFTATQELNGVTVMVNGNSNVDLIFRDQQRAQSGYIDKTVGPNPPLVLTDEEKASDAKIEAENERKRQVSQAQYQAEATVKCNLVADKLQGAKPMELADEAAWKAFKDANRDAYGGGIITYAERWARLMQVEMSNGKKLEDVAKATSFEADVDGITGFMHGAAVSILSRCWKYGDTLRSCL